MRIVSMINIQIPPLQLVSVWCRTNSRFLWSSNRPDQLKDVVDEAGSVVAGQGCVIVLQQFDNGVPTLACVVDHVVAAHVHIELHPVHLLRQVQDICMEE